MSFLAPKPKTVDPVIPQSTTQPQTQAGSLAVAPSTVGPGSLITTSPSGLTRKPNTIKSSLSVGG